MVGRGHNGRVMRVQTLMEVKVGGLPLVMVQVLCFCWGGSEFPRGSGALTVGSLRPAAHTRPHT